MIDDVTETATTATITQAPALVDLGPVAQLRAGRLPRRLTQLAVGLVLYGASLAMMVRAGIGLAPWDVLHSGFIEHVPITLGQAVVLWSFVVLALWIPLREKPGLGTVANAFVVGLSADATLAVLGGPGPLPGSLAAQVALMLAGVFACGLATALYIGAQFGRGPRDGLMTGLHRTTGLSIRLVRTLLEVAVVVIGLVLGGSLGIGTVVFALGIGPVTQALMPRFLVQVEAPAPRRATARKAPAGRSSAPSL